MDKDNIFDVEYTECEAKEKLWKRMASLFKNNICSIMKLLLYLQLLTALCISAFIIELVIFREIYPSLIGGIIAAIIDLPMTHYIFEKYLVEND